MDASLDFDTVSFRSYHNKPHDMFRCNKAATTFSFPNSWWHQRYIVGVSDTIISSA
jgi:hypothetical protein